MRCSTRGHVDSIFRTYGSLGRQERRPPVEEPRTHYGLVRLQARNAMPRRDAMRRYRANRVEGESGERAIQGEGAMGDGRWASWTGGDGLRSAWRNYQ
jgi:hypothetical protein